MGEPTSSEIAPSPVDGSGGGIYSSGGSLTITGSTISDNQVQGSQGLDAYPNGYAPPPGNAYGGGVYTTSGSLQVSNSTIENNTATGGPAGSEGGFARALGGSGYGGGLYLEGVSASICDSTISGNIATGGSGAKTFPVVADLARTLRSYSL